MFMALGLDTGVFVDGVFLLPLIVFPKDMSKLARAASFVNSACDIGRETQKFFFNPWI